MTAQVCKRCPRFHAGRSWCDREGKIVSQWNDWCEPRVQEWKEWRMAQTKGE